MFNKTKRTFITRCSLITKIKVKISHFGRLFWAQYLSDRFNSNAVVLAMTGATCWYQPTNIQPARLRSRSSLPKNLQTHYSTDLLNKTHEEKNLNLFSPQTAILDLKHAKSPFWRLLDSNPFVLSTEKHQNVAKSQVKAVRNSPLHTMIGGKRREDWWCFRARGKIRPFRPFCACLTLAWAHALDFKCIQTGLSTCITWIEHRPTGLKIDPPDQIMLIADQPAHDHARSDRSVCKELK